MTALDQLPPPTAESANGGSGPARRRWSPIGALALAAGIGTLLVAAGWLAGRATRSASPPATAVAPSVPPTQFVLVTPKAATVTVVGDFNDWNVSATPLAHTDGDDVWWVTVPLPPGRYRYSFVVNGTIWLNDPEAPRAEDDFGRPNSVVTVGGGP
jgi:hypothetical protein